MPALESLTLGLVICYYDLKKTPRAEILAWARTLKKVMGPLVEGIKEWKSF